VKVLIPPCGVFDKSDKSLSQHCVEIITTIICCVSCTGLRQGKLSVSLACYDLTGKLGIVQSNKVTVDVEREQYGLIE
jgi:hypothetical protein